MIDVSYTDPITHPITVKSGGSEIRIKSAWGRNVDVIPRLVKEHQAGTGAMLSELDIRRLVVQNPDTTVLINNYWDTPTLSARKALLEGDPENAEVINILKVVLPYPNGSYELTEAASFGLGLINPAAKLINAGVSLGKIRWNKLKGPGVYTGEIGQWFEKAADGSLVGYNDEMTMDQALKNPFLLTRLQHPSFVEAEFAISADEVAEIIGATFDLGKKRYGYTRMMGQYFDDPDLPKVHNFPKIGILKPMCVRSLKDKRAGMKLYGELDIGDGRFAQIT